MRRRRQEDNYHCQVTRGSRKGHRRVSRKNHPTPKNPTQGRYAPGSLRSRLGRFAPLFRGGARWSGCSASRSAQRATALCAAVAVAAAGLRYASGLRPYIPP